MLALIDLAGAQHLVRPGDVISVNKLNIDEGNTLDINNVLYIEDGSKVVLGNPNVDNVTVLAKVVKHYKDKKILIFKKIRRHNYRRKNGFRRSLSQIEILDIKQKG